MLDKLFVYLKKPEIYAPSTSKFWDDEHISKGMLEAHLNPHLEAASRQHDFIDRSVKWIGEVAPSSTHNKLLDLGCGPGLYTTRLYHKGYKITGIDFSQRSIDYAREKARNREQDIKYVYKNYLEIEYMNEFDVIILIYCDFAVLSDDHRKTLLKKIYKSLRPGGKFIFDVFTLKEFEGKKENNTWYISEKGGFWKPGKHLCIESHFIYSEDIRLDQYTVIDEDGQVDIIRNWFKGFTKEAIITELQNAGFSKTEIYSDVTGKAYSRDAKNMCVVAEK